MLVYGYDTRKEIGIINKPNGHKLPASLTEHGCTLPVSF
jgi:hypothetical protein